MDKKFLVVLGKNGSVNVIPEDASSPLLPVTLLIVVFVLSLCLNTILSITLLTNTTLRRSTFKHLLAHLSLACLLDAIFNVVPSVVFLLYSPRQLRHYGVVLRGNVATTHFTLILQSCVVACLSLDRAYATCVEHKSTLRANTRRFYCEHVLRRILPAAVWFYALGLVLPVCVLSRRVQVRLFQDRYSCGIVCPKGVEYTYPALLFICGHLIPWVVIVVCIIAMARQVRAERRLRRQEMLATPNRSAFQTQGSFHEQNTTWSAWFGENASFWEEAKLYVVYVIILSCFGLLLVPHILSVFITQFTTVLPNNTGSKTPLPSESTPVSTGSYDTVFIWCRYCNVVVVPVTVMAVLKEVRKKCELMFCCCCLKNNAVLHLDETRSVSAAIQAREQEESARKKRDKQVKGRKKSAAKADFNTPVLFATSEGLHLRIVDSSFENSASMWTSNQWIDEDQRRSSLTVEPSYRFEFCDVAIVTTAPVTESLGVSKTSLKSSKIFEEQVEEDDNHASHRTEAISKSTRSFDTSKSPSKRTPVVRFAETVQEVPRDNDAMWTDPDDVIVAPDLSREKAKKLYTHKTNVTLESSFNGFASRSLLSRLTYPKS